jgi:branched-chain amino acid transport system ATP-binding protein
MTSDGLHVESVSVRYGGVVANADVSIDVEPGQVVGLIGPNGAGKTTFIDAICGFTPATGSVSLSGRCLDGLSAHGRRRAGLARTWQAGELFWDLTVRQNVQVAQRPAGFRSVLRDFGFGRDVSRAQAQTILDRIGLDQVADRPCGELSLGAQRLTGVARAMAGDATVLLLDEPAAGLDTQESARFGGQVMELAKSGYGILLVDHDIELVFRVCSLVYVLDFGKVIACGSPATVRVDPAVREAYLGAEAATDVGAPVDEVKGDSADHADASDVIEETPSRVPAPLDGTGNRA